jgi:hypothetical protein
MRDEELYLRDIVEAAGAIDRFLAGMSVSALRKITTRISPDAKHTLSIVRLFTPSHGRPAIRLSVHSPSAWSPGSPSVSTGGQEYPRRADRGPSSAQVASPT